MKVRLYIFCMAFVLEACYQRSVGDYRHHPPGYDLDHPEIFYMHTSLVEISGIAFYNGISDTLYAEQDETGSVYLVRLGQRKIEKVTFRNHGDFEDISILGDRVVMLRSEGVLYSFPITEVWQRNIRSAKEWAGLLPKGEYEGMYADNRTNRFYVICKNCDIDTKKEHRISGFIFRFDQDGHVINDGNFQVSTQGIENRFIKREKKLKPSALAFNERTGEWYILSSVNKLLVIADKNWQIKQTYKLDPKLYIQPEGMAFDRDNTLYISNEGSQTKSGTVFRFKYQPELEEQ